MDGQILDVAQDRYMENAMLLRRQLVVLKAKEFGDGDESVKNANLLTGRGDRPTGGRQGGTREYR